MPQSEALLSSPDSTLSNQQKRPSDWMVLVRDLLTQSAKFILRLLVGRPLGKSEAFDATAS